MRVSSFNCTVLGEWVRTMIEFRACNRGFELFAMGNPSTLCVSGKRGGNQCGRDKRSAGGYLHRLAPD